jgi:hypothetical protein
VAIEIKLTLHAEVEQDAYALSTCSVYEFPARLEQLELKKTCFPSTRSSQGPS